MRRLRVPARIVTVLAAAAAIAACHPLVNMWDPESLSYGGTLGLMAVLSPAINPAAEFRTALPVGGLLYVAAGIAGLQVRDTAQPSTVRATVKAFPDGSALRADDVEVSGSYAYVACGGTLAIVDITSPDTPVVVGTVVAATSQGASSVEEGAGPVYLACDGAVYSIDVSSPAAPSVMDAWWSAGQIFTNSGLDHLYATYSNTLTIVSTADPANLTTAGSVSASSATGVFVQGTTAYVACGANGLWIFDVSDPGNPQFVGAVAGPPTDAWGVTVDGSVAYVADGESGLCVVDVSNPSSPVVLATGATTAPFKTAHGLAIDATGRLYCAEGSALEVFDVSDPASPVSLSAEEVSGGSYGIALLGTYALIATSYGLDVVDVSAPASASVVRRVHAPSLGGIATYSNASGTWAYLCGYPEIAIVDVSAPSAAAVVGEIAGYFDYVCAGDNWLCVTSDNTLSIYDLADPAAPAAVGTLQVSRDYISGVVSSSHRLYVISRSDYGPLPILEIVDVSSPAVPFVAGSCAIGDTSSYFGAMGQDSDTELYVWDSGTAGGVLRINVSDSAAPSVAGTYASTSLDCLCFRLGTLTCVSAGRLEERDYSGFSSPVTVGFFELGVGYDASIGGYASAIAADESHVYVTSRTSGLTILGR